MKLKIFLCFLLIFYFFHTNCFCKGNVVTVVLDPGHGGTNSGANYDGVNEKILNLKLAKQVKKILLQYKDINVIMTREEDNTLNLRERAEIGEKYGADILISLHFNASEKNNLYGSEVWTSGFGEFYARGMDIGKFFIENFKNMGLLSRGVKTKMSDNGDIDDYYGIIRESVSKKIPAIIVEHCYLDFEKNFISDENILKFAKADADAIIRYFNLGTKKSGIPALQTIIPTEFVRDDLTAPDKVNLNVYKNFENKYVLSAYAEDKDTPIIYFSYSIDGGKSWSGLKGWTSGNNNLEYEIPEKELSGNVILRAYNNYDLFTESNFVLFTDIKNYSEKNFEKTKINTETNEVEITCLENLSESLNNIDININIRNVYIVAIVVATVILLIIIIIYLKNKSR